MMSKYEKLRLAILIQVKEGTMKANLNDYLKDLNLAITESFVEEVGQKKNVDVVPLVVERVCRIFI